LSKGINLGDYEQLKWAVAHDACSPRYRMPCAAVPIGTPMRLQLSVQQHVRELVHSASVMMGAYSADVGAFE